MRNSKINKMVQEDAYNWARALMFFGPGAGTERNLLWAMIDEKSFRIPGYKELFEDALAKQNMADHAIAAAKRRKKIDSSKFIRRNLGALARGDRRGMSNGFAAVVTVAAVAHATGYDKKVIDFTKNEYHIAKHKAQRWNAKRKGDVVTPMRTMP